MSYTLRLVEDRLSPGGHVAEMPARWNRVLYVTDGMVSVSAAGTETAVTAGAAWHGADACRVQAGQAGARVLRFELFRGEAPGLGDGTLLLDHPIDLDPAARWLMRCDRVDFEPGGEAPRHRHKGGGIRCLLHGRLEVTVGDESPRRIMPGGAWFESGREPVYAAAAPAEETSFIRVTIQPAEIRGRSSIMYADPADVARKPRTYTVLVDEPIRI